MNYNSIEEILSSGTSNMQVLRSGTKQDDGTDTITGVNWFTFNGITASTIYASGNSFIGFGSSNEHLKVNRIDGALYYLYREEGTLLNKYKFLKIRWNGYSKYNSTSTDYSLVYDVILWENGNISIHMVSIPTSNNNGSYSLAANSTYTYSVSNDNKDITFIKTSDGFEIINEITYNSLFYYLIHSNSNYYTISNNTLEEITVENLTSSTFSTYGVEKITDYYSLLADLSNPEILCWCIKPITLDQGLVINGIPTLPQTIYYQTQDMTDKLGIKNIEVLASNDSIFAITFDDGQTWKYYDNDTWKTATIESEGMSAETIKNISSDAWAEAVTSTTFKFRCTLPTINSFTEGIYINYI